jgi:hypothetical protein
LPGRRFFFVFRLAHSIPKQQGGFRLFDGMGGAKNKKEISVIAGFTNISPLRGLAIALSSKRRGRVNVEVA